MGDNEETERDTVLDEALSDVSDTNFTGRKVTIEYDGEEHDVKPPGTYEKALGHDVLLNPNADVVVDHSVDADGPVATCRREVAFGVFLPRDSGTYWRFQSDGMIMKHPTMEGTLIPLSLWDVNAGRLPNANYLKHENSDVMEQIWASIEDDLPVEVEDVPAPDGYAQTQEAIRWVRITDHEDAYRNHELMQDKDRYIPAYRDWVRWAVEHDSKIALIYRNCD